MSSKWWFAPETFSGGRAKLQSTKKAGSDDRDFNDAQKLTITVKGAWVRDDLDGVGAGENDLILATKHQVGTKPVVDKVHCLRQEVPEKQWVGPFFHPVVYATEDFRVSRQMITLRVQLYDEDGLSDDESAALQGALTSSATAAAVAFPAFAPIAGFAASAGTALAQLVDRLDEHDQILDCTIQLDVNQPEDHGYDLLQPGFFVAFSAEIDADGLSLGEDGKVYDSHEPGDAPYSEHSYVVLRVRRGFLPTPDLLLDEKAATLLTEINKGKGSSATAALKYLRQTLEGYASFQKLERRRELRAKPTLSAAEKALLASIEADASLAPFLGQ